MLPQSFRADPGTGPLMICAFLVAASVSEWNQEHPLAHARGYVQAKPEAQPPLQLQTRFDREREAARIATGAVDPGGECDHARVVARVLRWRG